MATIEPQKTIFQVAMEKPTIEDALIFLMIQNLLFESMARRVMERMKADGTVPFDRWGDSPNDYPKAMLLLLWITCRRHVTLWMDAEMPLHFARPMFETKQEAQNVDAG